ncbi:MAG TPA: tRNA (adenosine(37)-N6)-threonylcarbamoyltransferase complex ATPase subunit type 1 TsaE [Candidatus Megaira endosymbiont of Nemacystus decipiens]|nr:tRNA (adenosine(37)-N6)-threonylcarbamoyltransferase complex ATPase subunit type 1 TsaE [Candidatus Megaera endosymbiont of Nemacystus decipiens]
MKKVFRANSEEETKNIARNIARNIKKPLVIALKGELGSGKSFFARCIIQELLEKNINVSSPTFNLLQVYELNENISIYHYDLYRLKDRSEIFELGIDDAMNNISIIEWPEIIEDILPQDKIKVTIHIINQNTRDILVT